MTKNLPPRPQAVLQVAARAARVMVLTDDVITWQIAGAVLTRVTGNQTAAFIRSEVQGAGDTARGASRPGLVHGHHHHHHLPLN